MDYRLMALVCHGNAYLAGKRWRSQPSDFSTEHGDFHFVRPPEDGGPDEEVADSPEGWFDYIAGAGALGLRIDYGPDAEDRNRVWMMNGVVEAAEVLYPGNQSEYWISYLATPDASSGQPQIPPFTPFPRLRLSQAFRDPSAFTAWICDAGAWPMTYMRESLQRVRAMHAAHSVPVQTSQYQTKTWKYMYRLQARGATEAVPPPDLKALEADLRRALTDIRDFAVRAKAGFIDYFSRALDILDERAPPTGIDFAPDGIVPPEAVRLMSACSSAWVFGGMMSWNDGPYNPPSDPDEAKTLADEYDRVSAALYLAITRAALGATNASCRVGPGQTEE